MIRVRTTSASDTPHSPELAPLVGRHVSTTVAGGPAAGEPETPAVTPGTRDECQAAATRLRELKCDFGALAEQEGRSG